MIERKNYRRVFQVHELYTLIGISPAPPYPLYYRYLVSNRLILSEELVPPFAIIGMSPTVWYYRNHSTVWYYRNLSTVWYYRNLSTTVWTSPPYMFELFHRDAMNYYVIWCNPPTSRFFFCLLATDNLKPTPCVWIPRAKLSRTVLLKPLFVRPLFNLLVPADSARQCSWVDEIPRIHKTSVWLDVHEILLMRVFRVGKSSRVSAVNQKLPPCVSSPWLLMKDPFPFCSRFQLKCKLLITVCEDRYALTCNRHEFFR
jgi:hypothetical protein